MKFTVLILVSCSLLASVSADIFYGLNYGVSKDACPSYETVNRDFRILSQYTSIIRVYSVKDCNIGEMALKASQANRLKVYLGMWVDKTDSFDKELAALQQLVSSNSLYNVEAIIVGSEVMYREDMESSELVNHIEDVKRLVKPNGVQITTSDVYYKFSPDVVDAVDFVMMNAFIYWEGENIENAASKLSDHYATAKSLSKGKTVRISETGWPDNGDVFGGSVPTPENQKDFLLKTLCMVRSQGIDMIWFSAIDEAYKPGVEGHFGLLDSNRQLKSRYQYDSLANPCQ